MFLAREGEPTEAAPVQDAEDAGEQQEVSAEPEAQTTEPEGQEPPVAESEVAEVEINGKVYEVPIELKEGYIQNADYTRKTQDLAELRRSVTAEREAAGIERAFMQETAQERQQAAILDAQIAQFKQIDWGSMQTEDLLRTRAQVDQLREMRAEVDKAIQAKRGTFEQKISQARAQQLQAGQRYIEQHIKGFGQETQKELMEHGLSDGYLQDELARISDPRLVVTMWKAMQWDKLQASAPGVKNKAARAAPAIRPGASVKQPSQRAIALKRFKDAPDAKSKRQAGEDYFTGLFGGS